MTDRYGSNADTRTAEWQARADATPDDEPMDWRDSRRIEQDNERWLRTKRKPTAAQWAILNDNPWAEL